MEASQTPGDQGTPEAEGQTPETDPTAGEGTREGAPLGDPNPSDLPPGPETRDPRMHTTEPEAAPVPTASDEERLGDLSEEERNPAADQSPAATAAQDVVVGDPGLRDESQPVGSVGNPDQPVRTSAPPPSAQSGVPLPEDRAAGVEPGVSGPAVAGGDEVDEDETPEHDASEGQSATPPHGG